MGTVESGGAEAVLTLLVVVAIVAAAVRLVRVPYTVALVLTGLALALVPTAPRLVLTPGIILIVFLPVLLFYGAYQIDVAELRASLVPVTLLAVPGVLATALMVGAALHVAAGMSWIEGLLFGTIVAATDPVAVLAIFGELSAPPRLATIVTAESLFNDGTALVLYAAMAGLAVASHVDVGLTVERLMVDLFGSLALGAAVAAVGIAVLRRFDDALLETTITLIIAYGGYLLADRLGISGPLETVAAGILLGRPGISFMSPTTRLQVAATWEFLDFLANSLLFLLMGLALRPIGEIVTRRLGLDLWWPLVVAIVAVMVSRAVIVWAVERILPLLDRPLPRRWNAILTWAGLRGAVSLAAALSLPTQLPYRSLLLSLTFGIVLFTLLLPGLTMRRLLERLELVQGPLHRHDLELLLGRLRATGAAIRELEELRAADALDERLAGQLLERFRAREQAVRAELESASLSGNAVREHQQREALRLLLRVQHEAARNAYARGQISAAVLRELVADIDRELMELGMALESGAEPANDSPRSG